MEFQLGVAQYGIPHRECHTVPQIAVWENVIPIPYRKFGIIISDTTTIPFMRYTVLLRYTEIRYDIPSTVYQNKVWHTIMPVFHEKIIL